MCLASVFVVLRSVLTRRAAAVLGGLFVLLPGQGFAQETESWLGLPVTYKGRSYTFAPWPAVEVRDMKIATAQPILINRALVTPDWHNWITEFKTQRVRIHAAQVVASPAALQRLAIIDGRSTRKVTVLKFDSLRMVMGSMNIDLPAGEMDFAADGTLAHVKVVLDQGLSLELSPQAGKLAIMLQAGSWKWAGLPALLWDNLVASGEIVGDTIVFNKIGGNSDGGSVRGNIRLAVTDRFDMSGELNLESMRAGSLLARVFPRHTVQGTLQGTAKVAAKAEALGDLGKDLSVAGNYTIRNGSVDRFGLFEGLRKSGGGAAGGGLTRFEVLSGSFTGKAGQGHVVSVQRLDGGAMQGSGKFDVAADGKLKGYFSGSVRLPGGETSSRGFALTGSVEAPTLMINN